MTDRRRFLQHVLALAPLGLAAGALGGCLRIDAAMAGFVPWFEISLAQWSLHRAFESGVLDPLEFAAIARRDYGITAVEYVNSFYAEQPDFDVAMTQLKRRAQDEGVRSVLIMCDGEGRLGDADGAKRAQAVRNHHRWVDAAQFLGCHSIRVNASSTGTPQEQRKLVVDGLRALSEYGHTRGINVIVENHGGLSSNSAWLAAVIREVDHPRCGTLPDFGNFNYPNQPIYDRYRGVEELMPFAKGVSAKSMDFDAAGFETTLDYPRLLRIVRDAGYHGYIGIEYEGERLSEPDGIRATKVLLERLRTS